MDGRLLLLVFSKIVDGGELSFSKKLIVVAVRGVDISLAI